MGISIYNKFDNELLKDEKILWTGQPDPSIIFTREDIFLIPFSLIWGIPVFLGLGFPTFELTIYTLFQIPFLLIGFYLIIGRFIV
jgi:hypothetical protein